MFLRMENGLPLPKRSPEYEALLQKAVEAIKSRPKIPPKSWAKRLAADLAKFTD